MTKREDEMCPHPSRSVLRAALRTGMGLALCAALCLTLCRPLWASGNVERALALLEKFTPGMTYEQTSALLDAAAEANAVGGDKKLLRRAWLHGEFGVEIYFLEERAYRIDVLPHFAREQDVSKALDEVLRLGQGRYGSAPRFDLNLGEYYWIAGAYRLSFCKAGPREVRLSRRAAR